MAFRACLTFPLRKNDERGDVQLTKIVWMVDHLFSLVRKIFLHPAKFEMSRLETFRSRPAAFMEVSLRKWKKAFVAREREREREKERIATLSAGIDVLSTDGGCTIACNLRPRGVIDAARAFQSNMHRRCYRVHSRRNAAN